MPEVQKQKVYWNCKLWYRLSQPNNKENLASTKRHKTRKKAEKKSGRWKAKNVSAKGFGTTKGNVLVDDQSAARAGGSVKLTSAHSSHGRGDRCAVVSSAVNVYTDASAARIARLNEDTMRIRTVARERKNRSRSSRTYQSMSNAALKDDLLRGKKREKSRGCLAINVPEQCCLATAEVLDNLNRYEGGKQKRGNESESQREPGACSKRRAPFLSDSLGAGTSIM